jgi:capsular polysaccharide transport system ATP-binding protein
MLVGDQNFQRKCRVEMFESRADRSMIVASHSPEFILAFCNKAVVIHRGEAVVYEDVSEAVARYDAL